MSRNSSLLKYKCTLDTLQFICSTNYYEIYFEFILDNEKNICKGIHEWIKALTIPQTHTFAAFNLILKMYGLYEIVALDL